MDINVTQILLQLWNQNKSALTIDGRKTQKTNKARQFLK